MCEHKDFRIDADVMRLTEVEGGPVTGYEVKFKVTCTQCFEPFCFRGAPLGVSQMEPRLSLDSTELRAPIHPMSDPTAGLGMIGLDISIRDEL